MRRARRLLAIFIMFLLLGVGTLLRYSEKVRFHDFVGTAVSGALVGVALVRLVRCWLVLSGRLRPADRKPAEEQAPVPDTRNQ